MVHLVAEVVVQVEKCTGMAGVEHGRELGPDGQTIDQQLPQILDRKPV